MNRLKGVISLIYNKKLKKVILILTGAVFLLFPFIDYSIAEVPDPSIFMYSVAIILGISYIVYGILYKTDK